MATAALVASGRSLSTTIVASGSGLPEPPSKQIQDLSIRERTQPGFDGLEEAAIRIERADSAMPSEWRWV